MLYISLCRLLVLSLGLLMLSGCSKPKVSAEPSSSPSSTTSSIESARLLPRLKTFADGLSAGFSSIPADRKRQLDKLALFLKARRTSGETAKVIFICTHNSRRSHLGQITATLAAAYFNIDRIQAYSGGTEVTAFNPRAVAALKRIGFQIENPGGENPHYKVTFAENRNPIEAFSKKYDSNFNPDKGFAAVMTCGHADRNCPTVSGATLRVPLHFVDPKVSDGTPEESETYDARALQIATEVFYAFSKIKA